MIGIQAAKTLSHVYNIPLIPINHMEGHIMANFLDKESFDIPYPYFCLIVSGGHTIIIKSEKPGNYETIGRTIDDAGR